MWHVLTYAKPRAILPLELPERAWPGTLPRVARETDQQRLEALRAAFGDTASNVPDFTNTALTGGHRTDEGLRNLLPPELSDYEKRCALKRAIAAALRRSDLPTMECAGGDAGMQFDTAWYYHFRVAVAGVPLFVKVFLDAEGPDPDVVVISVKRDDRPWK